MHREITDAAKKANTQYPPEQMTEGWVGGLVVEAALQRPAGRRRRDKIAAAMDDLKVDTKGLRGGPLEWTKNNHFRTQQSYRVYRWDGARSSVA